MTHEGKERVLYVVSPFVLLAVWELAVRGRLLDLRFFPAPSAIVGSFVELLVSGGLVGHTGWTVSRLVLGFAVGAVPGLVLGTAMGLSRWLRALIMPWVAVTYPIPKTAVMPLLMLLFGLGEGSKIAVVAIGVFYLVVLSTAAGVMNVALIYYDVGRSFGARRWQTFSLIAIPGALPLIMSGVRLGMGFALLVVVVAEFMGPNETGIGYLIWNAWQTFNVRQMYAALINIAILGYAVTGLVNGAERLLVPWKHG